MTKTVLFISALLYFQFCFAQDDSYDDYDEYEETPPAVVETVNEQYDDEQPEEYSYEQRNFEEDLPEHYSGKAFDYTEDPPDPVKPQPVRIQRNYAFFEWLARFFQSFGKILLYIIIGIAALIVAYVLAQSIYGANFLNPKLKRKKINSAIQELEENHDDIADNNYIGLAQKAESEGNYRMAFRYLFLDLLQNLNFKSYIDWKKNKTNNDYSYEIKNPEIQKEYKDLAHNFDYVWYGELALDQIKFNNLKKEFEIINRQLK